MTVYLDSSIDNEDSAHFIDQSCVISGFVYRDSVRWYYLYTLYNQCKTSSTSTMSLTTYHNQVFFSSQTSSAIYREDDVVIAGKCNLHNKGQSSVSFDPESASEDFIKEDFGNFTFNLELFTDSSFTTPYPKYESVKLDLDSTVNIGASVKTYTTGMVLFLDSCRATPNPDPDANPNYQLILNSCGVDSTIQFHGQSESYMTSRVYFSFKTFGFHGDYSTVFIHCKLSICNESDPLCRRDCDQRSRRDTINTPPKKLSDAIPMVVGPIKFEKLTADTLSSKTGHDDSNSSIELPTFVAAILFTASLVALLLASILWFRSRADKGNQYQKIQNTEDM